KDVSIPNGVPYVSAGSEMVYGMGQRKGIWGLEGMDLDTGESTLWIPSGRGPTRQSMYSVVNIDDNGNAWTGGLGGYTQFGVLPPSPAG
ncbi:MAG: hypothetical protein M3306_11115, partial [Actinomycetota bacterium]|nr:hypothetical protein [Actinomycetota bacterium]